MGSGKKDAAAEEQKKVKAAAQSLYRRIRRWKGVLDVGYGAKEIKHEFAVARGDKRETLSLVVFVEAKGDYPRRKPIPKSWKGFPTDVREAVVAKFASACNGGDEVEPQGVTPRKTGTVGIFIDQKIHGKPVRLGLSNAHVLFKTIRNPDLLDIDDNATGTLLGKGLVNGFLQRAHDCASLLVQDSVLTIPNQVGNTTVTFNRNNSAIETEAPVRTHGAMSGEFAGKVKVLDTVAIIDGISYFKCIEIEGLHGAAFGQAGDSGSLVYDDRNKRSVGLFFAVKIDNGVLTNRGYAVTLENVYRSLGLK